jgi:uracil-DNA glycosylase
MPALSELINELIEEVKACKRCALHKSRVKSVPGEGPEDATIMFIGEAPGYHENQQGRPFVGPAGQFLESILASIGYRRDQVFIANVVKCRPPDNRDPLPDEIESCRSYLDRQIEVIKPRLVVTLGRYSMARYFPGASISRIHGQPRREGGIIYFPMYHPAAALHQPALKQVVEKDALMIPQLLAELQKAVDVPAVSEPEPSQPEQLSLF